MFDFVPGLLFNAGIWAGIVIALAVAAVAIFIVKLFWIKY